MELDRVQHTLSHEKQGIRRVKQCRSVRGQDLDGIAAIKEAEIDAVRVRATQYADEHKAAAIRQKLRPPMAPLCR
jgi:hypothetical protein